MRLWDCRLGPLEQSVGSPEDRSMVEGPNRAYILLMIKVVLHALNIDLIYQKNM